MYVHDAAAVIRTKMATENEIPTMTITRREYQRLVNQSTSGWKAFYELFESVPMQSVLTTTKEPAKEPVEDLTHLKKEFLRLLQQVHHDVSCPVCLEKVDTHKVVILNCGHFLCQHDHTLIHKGPQSQRMCPTCRRTIR